MSLKNATVAKVRFGQIKKKMTENLDSPCPSGSGTSANKVAKAGAKPKGRPRKDSVATPTKKRTPKSATKVTGEDDKEDASAEKFEDTEEKFKASTTDEEYDYLMQTMQVCAK